MKKANILLIIPPSPFLLDERVFPFLGILKIASAYELQGARIQVLDLSGISNYLDVVNQKLDEKEIFDFIGLTATTPQMPNAFEIASSIKFRSDMPRKVVLGGSHVTLMHTASKKELQKSVLNGRAKQDIEKIKMMFDVLVCGDGEMVLEEILKTDKGVIDVDDRTSPFFLTNKSFSELPPPARHLLDLNSYNYSIENHKATSLIGQLGCPFMCTFCSGRSSPYLRMIRNRSVDSIIKEVKFLHKTYGYTGFMFYDDELNVSKTMVELMNTLTDLQLELKTEFRLRGFIKAELFNETQAEAMYRAGFRWLLCGFESGDPQILKNIEKKATREDNTKVVEIAKKFGLKTKALMSIGHAGESEATIENTKNWLLETQPEDFDCTIITTYPGSPYYDFAVQVSDGIYLYTQPKTGDKLYQAPLDYTRQADYYKGVPGEYTSYVWTDYVSSKQLVELRDCLEKEVREKLNISFNPSRPEIKYEHSMGQGNLPDWILRDTEKYSSPQLLENIKKIKLNVLNS